MLSKKTLLVLFCSLVFPICPLLYGQATGSFSGTITDKTGSVVCGASVKATAQGTGTSRESKTDDSGHYLMPLLPIGDLHHSSGVPGLSARPSRRTSGCRSMSIAN